MREPPARISVGVVGLGYVGLPVALAFGRRFRTIGYDVSSQKVAAGRSDAANLVLTTEAARLADADFIVVAVPTPVDEAHQPDFGPLVSASATVASHMKRG